MRKALRETWIITIMHTKWVKNYPQIAIGYIFLLPALFLLLASVVLGRITANVMFGTLMIPILSLGINVARDILEEKATKSYSLFVTSPINPLSYVIGLSLSRLMTAIVGFGVFLAIGNLLGVLQMSLVQLILLLPAFILGWLIASMIGFVIGVHSKDIHKGSMIIDMTWALLLLLSPSFYPFSSVPSPVRPILYLLPSTYLPEYFRWTFGEERLINPIVSISALLAYSVGLTLLVSKIFVWREE